MRSISMNSNLDPSQREAVCCGTGPCEIIAGPGSGKTTVLTERILYLLDHYHIAPTEIVVMTFSRSAAAEMKGRFLRRSGDRGSGVRFGTFHSVFYHILMESSHRKYSLFSQYRKEQLLARLLVRHYPDADSRPSVEDAEKSLYRAKEGALEDGGAGSSVRSDYYAYLRENGYLDFDGMVTECRRLLTGNESVRRYWQQHFKAILVDEFQDVNREQYETLRLLCGGAGLFVVGDDDQSIYGFRGSSPAVMRQFLQDFPHAKRVFLQRNYRCSGNIVKASDLMIRRNQNRIVKTAQAVRPPGDRTVLKGFRDDREQFQYLAQSLSELPAGVLRRTAVIVRTNTHVLRTEKFLSSHGVLCCARSDPGKALTGALIRDLEAYLILSKGLKEGRLPREPLFQVMNRPERYLLRAGAAEDSMGPDSLRAWLKSNAGSEKEIRALLRDLQVLGGLDPEGFVRYWAGSVGYAEWAQEHLGSREAVREALRKVLEDSRRCRSAEELPGLLRREESRTGPSGRTEEGVRIMTMHFCKGLEFDRVYLPSLNEGIIPGRRGRTQEDFEEERRLLYVAMTRAKEHLELLYVKGTPQNPRPPSRFLSVYGIRSFVYSR